MARLARVGRTLKRGDDHVIVTLPVTARLDASVSATRASPMGSIAGTGAVTCRHMGAGLFAGPTEVPGVARKEIEKTARSFSDGTGPF